MRLLHEELSNEIIGHFYTVYNELGYGHLEPVYENALLIELRKYNYKAENQSPIKVMYREQVVGKYYADIIVEDKIILELKATPIKIEHELQLFNYLKSTDMEVGYVLSFGKEPKFERKYFSNQKKRETRLKR